MGGAGGVDKGASIGRHVARIIDDVSFGILVPSIDHWERATGRNSGSLSNGELGQVVDDLKLKRARPQEQGSTTTHKSRVRGRVCTILCGDVG